MNVQTTWHILYIDGLANFASWKYFGSWGGKDELEAIEKSQIESRQSFTRLAVFRIADTKMFVRSKLEEHEWKDDDE